MLSWAAVGIVVPGLLPFFVHDWQRSPELQGDGHAAVGAKKAQLARLVDGNLD